MDSTLTTHGLKVIQTGGTIDKDYPRTTGGYAFEICEPAVSRILQRAKCVLDYEICTVCRKDSQEITDDDRKALLQSCRASKTQKVLITHGTDTLIDTAVYLYNAGGLGERTIILTAAHKPETFKDSDADFNVGVAVGALQSLARPGVYIAMNGCIYPANNATRNMDTGQFMLKST